MFKEFLREVLIQLLAMSLGGILFYGIVIGNIWCILLPILVVSILYKVSSLYET